MRLARLAAVLLSAILSSGCLVVGLHPFYDDSSVEFDEGLLGTWASAEDGSSLRIERSQWRSYRITCVERGATKVLSGFLTRVGTLRLLDLSVPAVPDELALVLAVHLPVRVQLLGDALALSPLDYDWFQEEMQHGRLGALRPTPAEDDGVLLTAPTASVRSWLASRGRAHFDDPIRFTRAPDAVP